jgi:hypothetical protein
LQKKSVEIKPKEWRHDIQHNDIQLNDTQHK